MPEEEVPAVNAAAVKLPQFWSDNPLTWFVQSEAQFHIRGITLSRTKYYYLVAALPPEVANRVMHLLEFVPDTEPYESLKAALLQAYQMTDYQRAEALASLPPLGDQRPSELLARIRRYLPPDHKECFRTRYDFLSRLPSEIRATLLNSDLKLNDLALQADNLWSAFQSRVGVSSVPYDMVTDGRTERMTVDVDAVTRRSGPRDRTTGSNGASRLCWYHRRWGTKARDCKDLESGGRCEWQSQPGNGRTGRRN